MHEIPLYTVISKNIRKGSLHWFLGVVRKTTPSNAPLPSTFSDVSKETLLAAY
jgi:hypothetical protein